MSDLPQSRHCPIHGWYATDPDTGECPECILDLVAAEMAYWTRDATFPGHCTRCGATPVRFADCASGYLTIHCATCAQCTHCYGHPAACHPIPSTLTPKQRRAEKRRHIQALRDIAAGLTAVIAATTQPQARADAERLLRDVQRDIQQAGCDQA